MLCAEAGMLAATAMDVRSLHMVRIFMLCSTM